MALTVNLQKSTQALTLNLQKKGIQPPTIDVAVSLDVSGSFHDEHISGITSDMLTRLLPWGLAFDPDKKIQCYTFSHITDTAPDLTAKNYENYVRKHIVNNVDGYMGGTYYAGAIRQVLDSNSPKVGFVGRLFGKKTQESPLLVFVITDGETTNEEDCIREIAKAEADGRKVYFVFFGVGNGNFGFIRQLGQRFSNVGFVEVKNIRHFVEQSDDDLNNLIISPELVTWLTT